MFVLELLILRYCESSSILNNWFPSLLTPLWLRLIVITFRDVRWSNELPTITLANCRIKAFLVFAAVFLVVFRCARVAVDTWHVVECAWSSVEDISKAETSDSGDIVWDRNDDVAFGRWRLIRRAILNHHRESRDWVRTIASSSDCWFPSAQGLFG